MKIKIAAIFLVILSLCSCNISRELRGNVIKSKDHKTYLLIKEKESPNCNIYLDGSIWPYEIGIKGEVKPGYHELSCHGKVKIVIKQGTTFIFDYWGP